LLHQFAWIYVECSFVPLYEGVAVADEIKACLAARNFRLKGQYNQSHAGQNGALLQADLLFENGSTVQAALLARNQP
jgi:hypothetical protein